jgi:hypothetical protein
MRLTPLIKIVFTGFLLAICHGCVSIYSTPYPKDWSHRVSAEKTCLDVSGRYALSETRPQSILHLLFDEQAEFLEIVQNKCESIHVISKSITEEVISERGLFLNSADPNELHIGAPAEASFVLGVKSYGYKASMDSEGSLLLQYQSFSVGLALLIIPMLINEKGEWEKYINYNLAQAKSNCGQSCR